MQVEGIVIQKTPYKERDLICHVLLRSGQCLSVYIYGGRGGGKMAKGSIVESGFMLKFELQQQKKKIETPIHIVKEYQLIWSSDQIRNNYQALCLQSFYLEILGKLTVDDQLHEHQLEEHAGLFNVLSNALFYLDQALAQKEFALYDHLYLFFTKLIFQLGITPDTDHCLYCHKELKLKELCLLVGHEGGFSCHECQTQKDEFLSDNKHLLDEFKLSGEYRQQLKKTFSMQFKDYSELKNISHELAAMSFHYLNYQFGFKADQFKTWKLL